MIDNNKKEPAESGFIYNSNLVIHIYILQRMTPRRHWKSASQPAVIIQCEWWLSGMSLITAD